MNRLPGDHPILRRSRSCWGAGRCCRPLPARASEAGRGRRGTPGAPAAAAGGGRLRRPRGRAAIAERWPRRRRPARGAARRARRATASSSAGTGSSSRPPTPAWSGSRGRPRRSSPCGCSTWSPPTRTRSPGSPRSTARHGSPTTSSTRPRAAEALAALDAIHAGLRRRPGEAGMSAGGWCAGRRGRPVFVGARRPAHPAGLRARPRCAWRCWSRSVAVARPGARRRSATTVRLATSEPCGRRCTPRPTHGLASYVRLLESHLTARTPDPALRDRLAALATTGSSSGTG